MRRWEMLVGFIIGMGAAFSIIVIVSIVFIIVDMKISNSIWEEHKRKMEEIWGNHNRETAKMWSYHDGKSLNYIEDDKRRGS